jgi:very-short-patch-repair endonuclease
MGFTVIRFSNEEVLGNSPSAINIIKNKLSEIK